MADYVDALLDSLKAGLDALPYKELYMGFFLVVTMFHMALDMRQLRAIRRPHPPKELHGLFKDKGLYAKTQAYSLDKWWFGLAHGLVGTAETAAMVAFNGIPWAWASSGRAVTTLQLVALRFLPTSTLSLLALNSDASPEAVERWQSVMFVLIAAGWSMVSDLPWSLYSTFVIETKHGFNKSTLGLFFKDMLTSTALGLVIMPPVVLGLTAILQLASQWVAVYLWAFFLALALFMLAIFPTLIQPLFNKYEPLPAGPLREQIEGLAVKLQFPLRKLFLVDGSKRSGHSNAYMFGFGRNKRIVLYDTLIKQCSEPEIVAVLGHELGHWKLGHVTVNFAMGQAITLLHFSLLTLVRATPALYTSFGFKSQPALMSVILFGLISSPLDEVVNFLMHVVSRAFEFQADGFAVGLGYGEHLRTALVVMQEENKGTMHVDPLYSAYHYSHPPLVERLKAINAGVTALAQKIK
mmetsp:Transcript_18851/g.32205  ORF Transcript_18851/g.32205 Transcript_18851/m.32205 type:complete len:466 (+) Transcript_18851:58-1455(+)